MTVYQKILIKQYKQELKNTYRSSPRYTRLKNDIKKIKKGIEFKIPKKFLDKAKNDSDIKSKYTRNKLEEYNKIKMTTEKVSYRQNLRNLRIVAKNRLGEEKVFEKKLTKEYTHKDYGEVLKMARTSISYQNKTNRNKYSEPLVDLVSFDIVTRITD